MMTEEEALNSLVGKTISKVETQMGDSRWHVERLGVTLVLEDGTEVELTSCPCCGGIGVQSKISTASS